MAGLLADQILDSGIGDIQAMMDGLDCRTTTAERIGTRNGGALESALPIWHPSGHRP
jgi:hypothetical protein